MDPAEGLTLRPATRADLPAVGEVMLRSRRAAYPAMPASIHSEDDQRLFVAGWDLDQREVWVALADADVVGFVALTPTWLDFLFVHPEHAGSGVGSALLDVAKARRPDGFGLWVFESNRPARDFYASRGFSEVRRTDGAENEEGQPDVELAWSPGLG